MKARRARLERRWKQVYPTWTLHGVLAAGPPFDPALCAGGTLSSAWKSSRCATSWPAWYASVDGEIEDDATRQAAKAAASP